MISVLTALLLAAPASAALAWVANWLDLIGWRRARRAGAHWSEQARLLWPTTIGAQGRFWLTPVGMVLLALLLTRDPSAAALVGIGALSMLGTICGTLPRDLEIFPRYTWRTLGRQAATAFVLRCLGWLVLVTAAVAMPANIGWTGIAITLATVAYFVTWSRFAWPWIARRLGIFAPAPPRLQAIVDEQARVAGISYRHLILLRSGGAQAFALVNTRDLMFSERLLETLDDAEVGTIAAHELAHLTETRGMRWLRTLTAFIWIPWIFGVPLFKAFGPFGLILPWLVMVSVPFLIRPAILRMEKRADTAATERQSNEGVYAAALLKIHHENLLPVVAPEGRQTHPHLYDRMTAAGSPPDFPRPQPAERLTPISLIEQVAVGLLVAIVLIPLATR